MEKVAIYARVSTIENQEYERQVNDLTRIIKNQGYTEEQIEIFAEKISGYKKNEERPELTRLINICEITPKYFNAIYITEVSRLGRNPRTTRETIENLCDLNVQLYISNPPLATISPDGSRNNTVHMMLGIAIEFADIEAKTTQIRMKSGKLTRAMKGKTSNNRLPYGYKSDENGFLIIDKDEAEIIKQIFESYQSGIGTRIIATTLNQMNIPTKLNKTNPNQIFKFNKQTLPTPGDEIKWSDVVIGQILKKTIYKGIRKYKGDKIIDGDDYTGDVIIKNKEKFKTVLIDAPKLKIIEPNLFDECNQLLKSKSTRNFLTSYDYLLKDLIRCGCCGRVYMGKYVNKKVGEKIYKCTSNIKKSNSCGNRSINMSLIESVLYDQVLNSETLLKHLENPNDIIKEMKKELKLQEQLLKNEQNHLKEKGNQLENLLRTTTISKNPNLELYANLEKEILNEIENIEAKIRLLTKDIFSKSTTIQNFNIEATSREMILNSKHNRPELAKIFKQFIKGIIVNDLGNGYILANVTIKIKGIEMIQTLKLFIYANGVRKYGGRNEKIYRYLATTKFSNNPVYKENILMVDIAEINQEFNYLVDLQDDTNGLIDIIKFRDIEKENRLYINEFDL